MLKDEAGKEVLMDFPMYIQTKIPFGTSYKGYEEKGPGIESFHDWFLNGFPEGAEGMPYRYTAKIEFAGSEIVRYIEFVRGPQRDRSFPRGGEIIGEYLMVNFPTANPLLRDQRSVSCLIKWIISKADLEKIWEELKKDPQKIFKEIDPELLSLCPPVTNKVKIRFLRETFDRRFEQEGV